MRWDRVPPLIADATSTSSKAGDAAILTTLAAAASGIIGGAAGWLWSKWSSRRTDAIKELGEIIQRLKGDIKEIKEDNAECIAHHEKTERKLDDANHRIAELTEEVITLRVKTTKDAERTTHVMRSVTGLVLDNTAGIAALAARVDEPPAASPPEEPPP